MNSFFLRHLTLKIILINHPCTYLYSSYNSPLVNIFCFKNPFDYLIEKYANPRKIMKRKCGGRRFTLIFEELRFLAISLNKVRYLFFFLRRKKKTMDNCCHNYVPYVCYVRITVSVSHIAQNILHNCRHSSLATKRRVTKEKKFSKKKNSINHKSMREHS